MKKIFLLISILFIFGCINNSISQDDRDRVNEKWYSIVPEINPTRDIVYTFPKDPISNLIKNGLVIPGTYECKEWVIIK